MITLDQKTDLPQSVVLGAELAELDAVLENAALGFHWSILDRLEDGVYLVDRERRVRYWSPGAERITGYSAREILGKCCADNLLRHVDADGRLLCLDGCPLAGVIADGRPRSADVFVHHKLGHRVPVHVYGAPIYDWQGNILGAFETFSDRTQQVAAVERIRTLEADAYLDVLTGIPNRRYLEQALQSRLVELHRGGLAFGLILGDVDHFKRFNDTYGHKAGDEVLKMVAQTLKHSCRTYDLPGRWGGEEFLVLAGHGSADNVQALAARLVAMTEHSMLVHDDQMLHVTISLGATVARVDDSADSLLARADELLYKSKSAGRNRFTFEP